MGSRDVLSPGSLPTCLVRRGVYATAQQLMTVDVRWLVHLEFERLQIPSTPLVDVDFRFLTADDVRCLAYQRCHQLDSVLASRLAIGRDVCYAAFHQSELVAYGWYSLGWIEASLNRSSL